MEKTATLNLRVNPALKEQAAAVNAELMTNDELLAKLRKGLEDAQAGRVQDADTAFQAFRGNL